MLVILFHLSAGHIEMLLNFLMMANHLREMTDDNIDQGWDRGNLKISFLKHKYRQNVTQPNQRLTLLSLASENDVKG